MAMGTNIALTAFRASQLTIYLLARLCIEGAKCHMIEEATFRPKSIRSCEMAREWKHAQTVKYPFVEGAMSRIKEAAMPYSDCPRSGVASRDQTTRQGRRKDNRSKGREYLKTGLRTSCKGPVCRLRSIGSGNRRGRLRESTAGQGSTWCIDIVQSTSVFRLLPYIGCGDNASYVFAKPQLARRKG